MPPCRIVFLRHGQTEWNAELRMQGTKDVPLNETGIAQIRAACRRMEEEGSLPFAGIVSSPLLRARQSADICAETFGLPVLENAAFRERSFGELEGLTVGEIRLRYGIGDVEQILGSRYGVESMQSLAERVDAGLAWLRRTYGGQSALAVTHGSVIRIIAERLGSPIGIIDNGCYREWEL